MAAAFWPGTRANASARGGHELTRKPLILLVDDDREIILGLSLRMRAANYEIAIARDGKEGLASARENRPDAIILDVRMPVMDGLTMLGELRANEATAAIPVVVLSANIASSAKARALELGARYFIQKPYESSTLIQAVRSALGPETSDRAELELRHKGVGR